MQILLCYNSYIMNERIVFMGTPAFAANVLKALIENNYNIVAVVSQADKKIGRKQILTPSPVKEVGLEYGIPVLTPLSIKDDYQSIIDYKPDLIITCAYGQFIPSLLIEYPKYKSINIHGSLLPKYRGGAPIQRSIINGDEKTGISIIFMTKKMDAGDILYMRDLNIDIKDTNTILFDRLSNLAKICILNFLPDFFKGNYKRIAQDEKKATFAYNLTKDDEYIDFDDDVLKVYNHIRGLLEKPGAYSILNNRKYKFIEVFFAYDDHCDPGIFKGLFADYLRIDCQNGFIKVYKIKPEGKNTMDAKSFYNGNGKNLVGERFDK